ncbi:MAG: class I SAM-dependent methyltransferase, partial [Candidatus Omnitrophica bacterium]|nr:class I SAM-dependent methyltransferase [Candidatus Omnitrophota bacterium]
MDNRPNAVFARCEGARIAYYRTNDDDKPGFWDRHWEENVYGVPKAYYRPYLMGFMGYGPVRDAFNKFLPRDGLILEAGCGTARYVVSLRARGYNCTGVDFAPKTVQRVKDHFPDLPVEVGDVRKLNLKDGSIDAYISLGVMEHFKEGPNRAISEAHRVLKIKG